MTKINLLLVEDNDTDALLVVRHLKKEGFEVDHVQVKTRDEMEHAFATGTWDIVISDYSLPGFGGKDALELFKSKQLDIPFILVSGTVGEDIAVTIMKGGANDYLMKTHLHRLGPAVKRELEETQIRREKRRIESVLDRTEKRFQRLIEELRDFLFLSDADGQRFYLVNPAFELVYGYPIAELERNPGLLQEAVIADDRQTFQSMMEVLRLTGSCQAEYRIIRPDHSIRWVYDRRTLVYSEEETNPLMGGVVMDITEKKQAEDDLRRAKEEAEKSSRLKSTLLQNMSHEFRTPMNGILGFSEILMDELEEEDTRMKASFIFTSGRRLQQTLDAIMLLAQLESGITLKPEDVDLSAMLTGIADTFRVPAGEKGLTIRLEAAPGLSLVTDEFLLMRAITDLVDNAFKFTKTGEISLIAGITGQPEPSVRIMVCDTGIGILPDKLTMIFEEFRQAEEGYNRPYEGSGLGLSIAAKSIRQLGGTLSVESIPGEGSSFTISLPLQILLPLPSPATRDFVPEQPKPPAPAAEKKSGRILLVEDNEANVELVTLFLRNRVLLDVARNGEQCLELVRKTRYDGILMDINLGPGMNGIEAIEAIRKMPENRMVPIAAVTGYTFRNEREDILSRGAGYFIEKPFTKEKLLEVVGNMKIYE